MHQVTFAEEEGRVLLLCTANETKVGRERTTWAYKARKVDPCKCFPRTKGVRDKVQTSHELEEGVRDRSLSPEKQTSVNCFQNRMSRKNGPASRGNERKVFGNARSNRNPSRSVTSNLLPVNNPWAELRFGGVEKAGKRKKWKTGLYTRRRQRTPLTTLGPRFGRSQGSQENLAQINKTKRTIIRPKIRTCKCSKTGLGRKTVYASSQGTQGKPGGRMVGDCGRC